MNASGAGKVASHEDWLMMRAFCASGPVRLAEAMPAAPVVSAFHRAASWAAERPAPPISTVTRLPARRMVDSWPDPRVKAME